MEGMFRLPGLRGAVCGVVSNVASLDDEDDIFSNIGGVVPDAFQMTRDENQFNTRLNGSRVAEHIRQQLAEDLIFQTVQDIIPLQYRLGRPSIARDEGVQRIAQHFLC